MRKNVGIPNKYLVRSKLLLDSWKGTCLKKEKQLDPLKREADLKMLVTTDQVNQYEKSENCILAVVYCVLCKIHFQSAHR